MAVVYRHTHDDGTIFYIGIGKKLKRAYTKDRRSPIWKYAVNKYGLNVEILHDDVPWNEACQIEMDLIKQYGRKAFGEGTLVNLTEGGEGRLGLKASEETKAKMSESHKGKNTWSKGCKRSDEDRKRISESLKQQWVNGDRKGHSEETRKKIGNALKGRTNGAWLGRNHSEETLKKMKEIKSGENNSRYGTKHSEETKQKMRAAALKRYNKI